MIEYKGITFRIGMTGFECKFYGSEVWITMNQKMIDSIPSDIKRDLMLNEILK